MVSLKHLQENKFQYGSLLVIFVLMMFRQWERVHYYVLYAEDANIFFSRTFMYGYHSILMPYAGYLQVAPQLISLFSYHITPMYYPIVTLFICSFIYASAISQVVSPSYSWINNSLVVRFFLALSLTFIPGTIEIVGNLANLHTVLFIYATFRVMAKFDEKYSLLDYILFVITAFSAGEFFLILPILLYRIFIVYTSRLKSIYVIQNLLILIIIITSIIVNYKIATGMGVVGNRSLSDYVSFFIGYFPKFLLTISNRIFYLPFIGNSTIWFNQYFVMAIVTGVTMLFLTGLITIRNKMYNDRYFILLIIALIAQMLLILLTASVRTGAENTPYLGQLTDKALLWVRYCIFMMPIVMIFWQVFLNKLLERLNLTKMAISLVLIFVSLYTIKMNGDRVIFRNFYGVPPKKLEEKYLWPYNARLIYNMVHDGKPETLTLPSGPMGWDFTITQPQK
ncbi:MAG TPA: hypothetical protein VKR58_13360 [Aquella sp.]|nr:hypothetical protein [Aquella sp.]